MLLTKQYWQWCHTNCLPPKHCQFPSYYLHNWILTIKVILPQYVLILVDHIFLKIISFLGYWPCFFKAAMLHTFDKRHLAHVSALWVRDDVTSSVFSSLCLDFRDEFHCTVPDLLSVMIHSYPPVYCCMWCYVTLRIRISLCANYLTFRSMYIDDADCVNMTSCPLIV